MVNEAVIIEKYGPNGNGGLVRRTVASNAAISYGTLLQLTSPNTAVIPNVAMGAFAGIAAEEKVNNDYATSITVFTDCVADLRASLAITVGAEVTLASGANGNWISQAVGYNVTTASLAGFVVGIAQETGATDEVIRVRINI